MLPGLFKQEVPDIFECKTLLEINNDVLNNNIKFYSEYKTKCQSGCELFHLITYLQSLYKLKKYENDHFIYECLKHSNSLVRLAAIRLIIASGKNINILNFLNDPNKDIRIEAIKKCAGNSNKIISRIIESTFDEHSDVKCISIKKLCKLKIRNGIFTKKISERIANLMTDTDFDVRLQAARSLKYLIFDNPQILFDKSKNGAFIYGLEDEFYKIRVETLKSISSICKDSIHNECFDYILDLLNDDSEKVRITASKILKNLGKKFSWKINKENLNIIISNLDEINSTITDNLLKFCGYLIFSNDTFYIFDHLLARLQRGRNLNDIYKCIKNITKRNLHLFHENAEKIHPFKSKFFIKEPLIIDRVHIGKLVSLYTLHKNKFHLAFPPYFYEHFKFIKHNLYEKKSKIRAKKFRYLKRKFIEMINRSKKNHRTPILYKKLYKTDSSDEYRLFFSILYVEYCRFLQNSSMDRIKYLFIRSIKSFSSKSELNLEDFIEKLELKQIEFISFVISTPSIVECKNSGIIDFNVKIAGPIDKKYLLRIVDCLSEKSIYYEMGLDIKILLKRENVKDIGIAVVLKENPLVLFSKEVFIKISD